MAVPNPGFTLAIVAIAAFGIYRRARRNIGRQPFKPRRLVVRIIIFSVICLLVIGSLGLSLPPHAAEAMAAGTIAGVTLGLFGLRHTDFEFTPAGDYYTPHTYIGLTVTFLLVARVLYRLVQLNALGAMDMTGRAPPPAFGSPLTLGVLFLTAGYYIAYYAGLLQRLRSARAAAPAV